MGLTAMRGAAVVTIIAVLVVMLAAVTLLPALLGFVGHRIDRLRLPVPRSSRRPLGARWAVGVQRRPWLALGAGLALLVLLALPFLGVRYGFPDAGNDRAGTTTRQAYDMLADGFGPGANGPLLLVSEDDGAALAQVRDQVAATPGVAAVTPPQAAPGGGAAMMTVVPTTSPQSADTERLVGTLRDEVAGTGIHVGGVTAAAVDTNEDMASRLPLLIGGVVGLSFLLLLTVFRSLAVAIKAAVLNLLSLAAAYGVVALVLQGGWAGRLIGIDTPTPLPAFIPVLMFAVLFGLSMDYEVFLLTRIRERWLRTGDTSTSVDRGPGPDRPGGHRGGGDHDRGVRRVRAEPGDLPQGDRGRDGGGDPHRRDGRADAAGARGDAAARPGELVAAGLAGPDPAAGPGRGRGRPRGAGRRSRRCASSSPPERVTRWPARRGRPPSRAAPAQQLDAGGRRRRPTAPAPRAAGTPTFAAFRPVRKSRISQPRARASIRSAESGLTATARPTADSIGRSLIESLYAEHRSRSSPSRSASASTAAALAGPCSGSPTSRPVYSPSTTSATVPSAPVSPSRRAMIEASSTGVAVTSQTRWPASRCSWASAWVPVQIRSAISSS